MKNTLARYLFLAAALAPAAPAVALHLGALWASDHYRFFPLVLLGFVALLARTPAPVDRPSGGAAVASLVFALLGLMLVAAAGLLDYTKAGMAGAYFLLLGAILVCWDRHGVRQLLPAWLYLWVIIPLPFGWDDVLLRELQRTAANGASAVLDQLGVYHIMTGNVVETGTRRFEIESACSGVRSLFTILAATLFLLIWFRTSFAVGALVLAMAAGWTLAVNIARVVLTVFLPLRYAIDVSAGLRHDSLGIATFVLAVVLAVSSLHLSFFLFARRPDADDEELLNWDGAEHSDDAPPREWRLAVGTELVLYVVAAASSFTFFAPYLAPGRSVEDELNGRLAALAEGSLPERLGGWERHGFLRTDRAAQSVYGKHSATWQFIDAERPAAASVDYPWRAWHDLQVCYRGGGWEVTGQDVIPADERDASGPIQRLRLRRGDRLGVVFFQLYSLDGRPFVQEPLEGGLFGDWLHRAKKRLAALGRRGDPPVAYYQVQTFSECYSEPARERIESELLALFRAAQRRVAQATEPGP